MPSSNGGRGGYKNKNKDNDSDSNTNSKDAAMIENVSERFARSFLHEEIIAHPKTAARNTVERVDGK